MLIRVCLSFALLAAAPAWSQVNGTIDTSDATADTTEMQTPPPINDQRYPTETGNEARSNYLSVGAGFSAGYIDSLYPGGTAAPLSETVYSIYPAVSLDARNGRQQTTITYTSGYTFYHPSSVLNLNNQNVAAVFSYRFTPHMTLVANDSFSKSSNLYGQAGQTGANAVTGSLQPSTQGVLAPFADQLTNAANAELTVQTSRTMMVGGSFSETTLHYLNSTQAVGLSDGSSLGGMAFFNQRISESQYIGATYQYSRMQSYLLHQNIDLLTHTISAFYTLYISRNLSLSVSAGPEHYQTKQPVIASTGSWTPAGVASLGWQGPVTSFSVSYSREVAGGGGLVGASTTNAANASARWLITPSWNTSVGANYASNKNATPFVQAGFASGHSIGGNANLEHRLTAYLLVRFEYARIHQSYGGIQALASNPNSNSETGYLMLRLRRPLGR